MGKRKARRPARAAYAPRLIVMAKSPRAGRAKRRLAASVGAIPATRFYRSCLAHTLMRLARDPRWQTLLAVSPDSEVSAPFWPRGIERQPQGDGDLGARHAAPVPQAAARACDHRRQRHPGYQGKRHRMRLSPARQCRRGVRAVRPDGGYWLVGLRRTPRLLAPFAGVRWSGPHALADTLGNLKGSRVAFAATLSDVDTEENYRRLRRNWQRLIQPSP